MFNLPAIIAKNSDECAYYFIAAVFFFHIFCANIFGLGVDEAHYGLFALKLDLSYFDHPPMVGWLQLLARPFYFADYSLRLVPGVLLLINNILLYRLSKTIYARESQPIAFYAVLFFNLSLIVQLVGWGLLPDLPLLTATFIAIFVLRNLYEQLSWRYALLLGVALGLAGLSKYTAITIPIAILLWLKRERKLGLWLKDIRIWSAFVLAFICIAPVLIWNYQHDWMSFKYQLDHGGGGQYKIVYSLRYLLILFFSYAPILFFLGVMVLANRRRDYSPHENLLFYIFIVNLILVFWSTGHGPAMPHWALLCFAVLTPLAAKEYCKISKTKISAKCAKSLLYLSIILFCLLPIYLIIKPIEYFPLAYRDLIGFKEAAHKAEELLTKYNAKHLWVEHWTKASRFAWYAHPISVQVINDTTSQFSLWYGHVQSGESAIYITETYEGQDIQILSNQCSFLADYVAVIKNYPVNKFYYYYCG